ncbi:metallopeptidase family protein [Pseudoglutamicibacter cumminsii]|uniref:Metallopeptidase family protein n=1 Tax=Pseudoglutamicibacter cumminsii TaxID=156979 RepID=A0ABX5L432_9MICC|nr:metallopeptidase family protein [Pseudoglutamicibacter cumminsii]PWI27412.1 hypothetical protein CAY35_07210 [Pseudoglutamicibacter cumminsii]
MAFRVTTEAFEYAAHSVYEQLPRELTAAMNNIHIFIEEEPEPGFGEHPDTLTYGYYDGTPLTERGEDEMGQLPDRIVLFKSTFEETCANWTEIVRELHITFVHEIAHHLGFEEDELHELGWG